MAASFSTQASTHSTAKSASTLLPVSLSFIL